MCVCVCLCDTVTVTREHDRGEVAPDEVTNAFSKPASEVILAKPGDSFSHISVNSYNSLEIFSGSTCPCQRLF